MKSAGREKDEIGLDVEGQPTFGSRQQKPKFVRHFTMSTNSEREIEIGGEMGPERALSSGCLSVGMSALLLLLKEREGRVPEGLANPSHGGWAADV